MSEGFASGYVCDTCGSISLVDSVQCRLAPGCKGRLTALPPPSADKLAEMEERRRRDRARWEEARAVIEGAFRLAIEDAWRTVIERQREEGRL